jgi:hypothetical protein
VRCYVQFATEGRVSGLYRPYWKWGYSKECGWLKSSPLRPTPNPLVARRRVNMIATAAEYRSAFQADSPKGRAVAAADRPAGVARCCLL